MLDPYALIEPEGTCGVEQHLRVFAHVDGVLHGVDTVRVLRSLVVRDAHRVEVDDVAVSNERESTASPRELLLDEQLLGEEVCAQPLDHREALREHPLGICHQIVHPTRVDRQVLPSSQLVHDAGLDVSPGA